MARPRRWLMLVVVATVGLAGACDSSTRLVIEGRGAGESVEFSLREGVYRVRWSAEDAGLTDHGCLFGLSIERTVAEADVGIRRRGRDSGGKLAYRAIGHGERFDGDEPSILLGNGSYRLRSEGSCAWQAEILPGEPGASPTRGTLEQDSLEQG